MRTIVSVTPLRLQEDSRTFKIAASFARFGYRSVVVEGQQSHLNKAELPFELISMGDVSNSKPAASAQNQLAKQKKTIKGRIGTIPSNVYRLLRKIMKPIYYRLPESSRHEFWVGGVRFLIFAANFMIVNCFIPLRHIPRASLYYLHAPYYFPAVYLLCKRYRVPFIYDAHDFYIGIEEKEDRTPFERRWVDPFLLKLERNCVKHAAAVVTVCDGVARLQEKTFKCHPVVARSCHDHRLDVNPKLQLRKMLDLGSDDFLIVTVGQAKKGQAIKEALEAMRKLPNNVHLAFLGKNTARYIPLIRELGLEKRAHPIPPVMPFEVVPFIQSADASLILYYARSLNYENCLPNGLFQSIAAELPLLYPELPEISKIAEYYDLGIPINPLDPESIRSGVIQLMSNRELDSKFRKNLRVAKEDLSWEREEVVLRDLLMRSSQSQNQC